MEGKQSSIDGFSNYTIQEEKETERAKELKHRISPGTQLRGNPNASCVKIRGIRRGTVESFLSKRRNSLKAIKV